MLRNFVSAIAILCVALLIAPSATAFTTQAVQSRAAVSSEPSSSTSLNQFGKKKKEAEDLSFIETRDLTREEMLEINRRNEEVMNTELQAMTGISVLFSLPILYLCWIAFFSD
ncbi:hypothetical protein THAOC_34728 [Thalassiosira oceanica]|uniref:RxLR effector protein n=1 Tax=Thalassiosira oceanica TaxID=159749 RepID=K0R2Z9_THAOC|nr:hypothetical protein THAOC_34728 [Thalassiosira oceanica]|mmetsp:Transcript_37069/g.88711  ORF Transcript_37069/g.88711 Transcript_37069/m.88711 type:complete len:113 (+) Transcript_37069:85-423(+)|eukprot:EJK46595.1 hypothetical protein THAOC_34728 [Thalassiosira oceanica]